jgi:hypothetical protein
VALVRRDLPEHKKIRPFPTYIHETITKTAPYTELAALVGGTYSTMTAVSSPGAKEVTRK